MSPRPAGPRLAAVRVCPLKPEAVVSSASGGFLQARGYDPVLAILLFAGALALHSRQLDLKLRLDYLWATQVSTRRLMTPHLANYYKNPPLSRSKSIS